MRPTSTFSVCLVVIGLGLTLVFCNYGRTDEPAKADPVIKELRMKRLAVLQQLSDVTLKLYDNGRGEFEQVLSVNRQLLAVRLETAETKQDRIKVCDAAIKNAEQLQTLAESKRQSARGTLVSVLQAQDYELEAQIARAKAEAGE